MLSFLCGSAPAAFFPPALRRARGVESLRDAVSAAIGVSAYLRKLAVSSNFLITGIEILWVTGR